METLYSAMDGWPGQKPNRHRAKLSVVLWKEKKVVLLFTLTSPGGEALGLFLVDALDAVLFSSHSAMVESLNTNRRFCRKEKYGLSPSLAIGIQITKAFLNGFL